MNLNAEMNAQMTERSTSRAARELYGRHADELDTLTAAARA
jgi:hypothetical protein